MKSSKDNLAYKKLSDDAKFREQFRFVFSGAVIATVFVVPNDNIFELLLKTALGFSAFFAALYLIATAGNVKYKEPGVMYQMLYIGERFRMRMYDFSVDTFAVAFLYFLGLLTVGLIQSVGNVELAPVWQWTILISAMLIIAVVVLLISMAFKSREIASKKKLPPV